MPAEAPLRRLRVAAIQHDANPAWQSFFPEDLPADWKLAYYGHFWQDLLVPPEDWAAWVEDSRRLDEVPDALRLYFRVPEAGAVSDCAGLASGLGARLGGFLFPNSTTVLPAHLQPVQVFQRLPDPLLTGIRSAQAFSNAGETVLLLDPDVGLGPRQWRALLETLHAASTAGRETLVFLRTGPDELEQVQTILRLSGLAWGRG